MLAVMAEIFDGQTSSPTRSLLLPPHGFADTEWSGETETTELWAGAGPPDLQTTHFAITER